MVGRCVILLLGLLLATNVHAQDIIVKKNGEEIIGKVVGLGSEAVAYRYFSDINGPVLMVPRSEVAQLKLVTETEMASDSAHTYMNQEASIHELARLRLQAKLDADNYYKAKGVFWTTMGSTIMHPVAGLATGTLISVVPPAVDAVYNPNRHLMKEPVYREAFQKQARKRKIGTAAAGFGAGAAVLSVIYMVIVIGIVGGA